MECLIKNFMFYALCPLSTCFAAASIDCLEISIQLWQTHTLSRCRNEAWNDPAQKADGCEATNYLEATLVPMLINLKSDIGYFSCDLNTSTWSGLTFPDWKSTHVAFHDDIMS